MLEEGDGAGDKAVEGENEDDAADDAVDEPHGANVEMGAHLVDKEGDDSPPQEGSHHYRQIAQDDMVELVFGQRETEAGEQRYDQEHDERVAQGEQEAGNHIPPLVVTLIDVLLNLAHGVVDNHVDGIHDKDDAAHYLQQVDMVGNKVGHQRDAQPDKKAVEQITCRRPYTREESRMAAIAQRALYAQDADRPHGCRQDDTY